VLLELDEFSTTKLIVCHVANQRKGHLFLSKTRRHYFNNADAVTFTFTLFDCSVVAVANDTLLILKLETKGAGYLYYSCACTDPLITKLAFG
jgi:hypothetical protein